MEGRSGPRNENALKSSLRQSLALLRHAAARYEDMIVKDPEFTSKLETVLRVASYIIPGAHYLELRVVSVQRSPTTRLSQHVVCPDLLGAVW